MKVRLILTKSSFSGTVEVSNGGTITLLAKLTKSALKLGSVRILSNNSEDLPIISLQKQTAEQKYMRDDYTKILTALLTSVNVGIPSGLMVGIGMAYAYLRFVRNNNAIDEITFRIMSRV